MSMQWYVARTKPLAEYPTQKNLVNSGIETFLPSIRSRRPRRGYESEPLFPGYLFIHCNLEEGEHKLLKSLTYPIKLVGFAGVIPTIPEKAIDDIKIRVDVINNGGGLWSRYRVGDRVKVALGKVTTFARVIHDNESPYQRVKVLLEFLGRMLQVDVPYLANAMNAMLSGEKIDPVSTKALGCSIKYK